MAAPGHGPLARRQPDRAAVGAGRRGRGFEHQGGRLRKAVLARDLYATAAQPLDVRALLHRLAARYPDCYTFACGGMVGATPELLIRREAAGISALVLAGTTPRGRDAAEDEALGAALLSSAKNIEEHAYAATGVREALAPLCEQLAVRPQPVPAAAGERAAPGHGGDRQLALAGRHPRLGPVRAGRRRGAAPYRGRLRHAHRRGDGAHPRTRGDGPRPLRGAGGLGGRARQRRVGHRLRCAEIDGPRARLFAGCGIVAGSDPAAELAEAQAKFRPMQDALEGRD